MSAANATREGSFLGRSGVSHAYPLSKTEDNCFYSRWIYGNDTAHLITWVRNSALAKAAYSPSGQVQYQGYRLVYGICLAAVVAIGLSVSIIRNFLAVCSVYYLGKKIWEYKNGKGPLASSISTKSDNQALNQTETISYNSPKRKDSRFTTPRRIFSGCEGSETSYKEFYRKYESEKRTQLDLIEQPNVPIELKKEIYCDQLNTWLCFMHDKLEQIESPTRETGWIEIDVAEDVKWMKRFYSAFSTIYNVEDPIKKIRTEVEAILKKKEEEFLSEDNLTYKRIISFKIDKGEYAYILKALSTPVDSSEKFLHSSNENEIPITIETGHSRTDDNCSESILTTLYQYYINHCGSGNAVIDFVIKHVPSLGYKPFGITNESDVFVHCLSRWDYPLRLNADQLLKFLAQGKLDREQKINFVKIFGFAFHESCSSGAIESAIKESTFATPIRKPFIPPKTSVVQEVPQKNFSNYCNLC